MTEFFQVIKSRCRQASAVFLSVALMSCALSRDAKEARTNLQVKRAVASLIARNEADSLAAAALFTSLTNRSAALALMERARGQEQKRADLSWLQAQMCASTAPCDPEPIEQQLRELDPSNGIGWIGALSRANAAKNDGDAQSVLVAISRSDHVDIYWTTLIARLSRATDQTHTMSLPDIEVSIIGLLAGQAIPAYQATSNACKGERLQHPEIVEVCRGVAKALERGDTYITEMMGVAIAKRVWPEDAPEWKAAVEARRVFESRSKFLEALDVRDTLHAEAYLTLCQHNRREQDVLLAQMIAAGVNPNVMLE